MAVEHESHEDEHSATHGATSTDQVQIHVEPFRAEIEARDQLHRELVNHHSARAALATTHLQLASFELLDKEASTHARFQAVVFDPATGQSAQLQGRLSDVDDATVTLLSHRQRPTRAEFDQAVEHVLRDPDIAQLIATGVAQAYQPMPPFIEVQRPDGSVERMVTVGVRAESAAGTEAGGSVRHQIVGVMPNGDVVHAPEGAPGPSPNDCEPPAPQGGCQTGGGPDQVHVRVIQRGQALWDFVLVRPRASSGTNGSGIELRFVDYKGVRVLFRAHLPILNVEYANPNGGCGPTYRDWQNQEACFHASGNDPVGPGFRVCTSAPQTILESHVDGGNFSGVALWYSGGELRLVSQLSAGWYRYISDWRLRNDGSIGPRWGFAGTLNPCTCQVHIHHAYWRLDFDIITAANNVVEEYNKPPIIANTNWHTKRFEIRRPRDASHQRHWRVRNKGTFKGYSILPGADDGTSDAYGVGDFWVLRYHGNELDDGQGFTTNPALSRANIDKFVNGEPVDGQDVVLWYAGHFRHEEAVHPGGHMLGPELVPFNW